MSTAIASTNNGRLLGRPHAAPSRVRSRGRPSKLRTLLRDSPEVYQRMLDLIRAGAFARVAAAAVGVAPETFSRWLGRGDRQRRGIYRQFRQDVRQAAAQARVVAEIQVYHDNPLAWLRLGPGRTIEGCPGWTDEPKKVPVAAVVPHADALDRRPTNSLDGADIGAPLKILEELGYITILPPLCQALIGLPDEPPPFDSERRTYGTPGVSVQGQPLQ